MAYIIIIIIKRLGNKIDKTVAVAYVGSVDVFNYSCGDQKSSRGQMVFLGGLGLRLELGLGLGARVRFRVKVRS